MNSDVIAKDEQQGDEWAFICKVADLPRNDIGTAKHPGGRLDLAIYQLDGEIYVTSDRCTHGAASLSEEGEQQGHIVECAWHNGRFDVRTGEALTMPCRTPLPFFDAKVIDGDIYINPKPKRFKKPE
ncbi:non-heme iron oxygenase ferredoxin subunit [Zhongshania guokunii]|uniref:Non-heme iron oxygenase ferredoxin subunit n=1 Tax=Zhongshania guokunii TaxID=641783 RepID=A0ABV3U0E1_9GAMM